jgi:hypothetical protein
VPDGRRSRPASRLGSREHGRRSRILNYSVPTPRSPSQAPRERGQLAPPRDAKHKKRQSRRRLRYRGPCGVGFYNPHRRHSSPNYLSPIDYERRHYAMIVVPDDHQPAIVLAAVKDASRRHRAGVVVVPVLRPRGLLSTGDGWQTGDEAPRVSRHSGDRRRSAHRLTRRASSHAGESIDRPGGERGTAAKRFFRSAKTLTGVIPDRVTTDGHDAYPQAIRMELGSRVRHQTNCYLNNRLEQDHRGIKGRCRPMLGFKSVPSARSRRITELPPLSISHVPTRSRRCTARSQYAPDSHRARYPASCLNGRLRGLKMSRRTGSKLTEPPRPLWGNHRTRDGGRGSAWIVLEVRSGRSRFRAHVSLL